jgi:malate dehydrogenase (oxaloacetate-decarboxylating)(NADP+)
VPIFDPKTKEEDARRLNMLKFIGIRDKEEGISLLDSQKWMREETILQQ